MREPTRQEQEEFIAFCKWAWKMPDDFEMYYGGIAPNNLGLPQFKSIENKPYFVWSCVSRKELYRLIEWSDEIFDAAHPNQYLEWLEKRRVKQKELNHIYEEMIYG